MVGKEHGGLGLRDLYGFNLAILGKIGRKFISPEVMVSRVFKAKYFLRKISLGLRLVTTLAMHGVASVVPR